MQHEIEEVSIQRKYYAETAERYDAMHVAQDDEHYFALAVLAGLIEHLEVRSILDVGSGTGRGLAYLKRRCPDVRVVGIEPVAELREVGHRAGIPEADLVDGDATRMQFADGAFDAVCAFGVLHHIRHPGRAIDEMLRVARKAVFISDGNNFGQGGALSRLVKQAINAVHLWPLANLVKTGGKGYQITEGDGLAYSYSVFTDFDRIRRKCRAVHLINTTPGGKNAYRSASHVAVLGIKG